MCDRGTKLTGVDNLSFRMQKIECKKHMFQSKFQQVLGQPVSQQLFPKRCKGHRHRLMDEALKCCVFTLKFEVIEQGANEHASDMRRFRECIDVIKGFDFSLDCYSTLGTDFDHHIAMLACMFSIISHKEEAISL